MPEYAHRRQFVAKAHLTYGPTSQTAKPGDVLSNLPVESIGWLLEQGYIIECPPTIPSPRRSAE